MTLNNKETNKPINLPTMNLPDTIRNSKIYLCDSESHAIGSYGNLWVAFFSSKDATLIDKCQLFPDKTIWFWPLKSDVPWINI